ncbi:MAG: hypothetical protein ACKVWR_02300 [Acidimicrobiales bacterium]
MASEFELTFPRPSDRELITEPLYQVVDWRSEHLLTYPTVELSLGVDGYQQLADDAALGRRVAAWRARSPALAALLDAEQALDALRGPPSAGRAPGAR